MTQKFTRVGLAAFIAGLVMITVGDAVPEPWRRLVMTLGMVVAVSASVAISGSVALARYDTLSRPISDAYKDGHAAGFAEGWRECASQHVRPVTRLNIPPEHASAGRRRTFSHP